jgi:heterodisulfide reductase subunit A
MVNIREHDSWVHTDRKEATEKAKALARAAIERVAYHQALEVKQVPIHPGRAGGGRRHRRHPRRLTLANAGKKVFLVEREPSIGGHMAKFDKTFPTLDCAACILTPRCRRSAHTRTSRSGATPKSPRWTATSATTR